MSKTHGAQHQPLWKVFLVDDDPLFREGMARLLEDEADLCVCGQAATAEDAMVRIPEVSPDVVLVDISLPGKSGLELVKELRRLSPQLKLLAVSVHEEALFADRVLRLGGDGYVMKQEGPAEIIHATRDVLRGHIYVSEDVLTVAGSACARGRTHSATYQH